MGAQKFIFDGEKLVEGAGVGMISTPEVLFHWLVNYESEETERSKEHNYFDCRVLIDHSVEDFPIYALVVGNIKQFDGKDTIVLRCFGYYLPDIMGPSLSRGILTYSELERYVLTKKGILNPCSTRPLRDNPELVSNLAYKALKSFFSAKTKDCFKFKEGRFAFVGQEDSFCIDASYYCIHGGGYEDLSAKTSAPEVVEEIFEIHMRDNFVRNELSDIANMGLGYPPGSTILRKYKSLVKKF